MHTYLLNVVYLLLALAASPWLVYQAIAKRKYREGFAAKLLGRVPVRSGQAHCIWLHAVSVGEVNLLGPLIAELSRRLPDWECVVSTTTMTGFALARKKYDGLTVFYCPLDFSWAVKAALRRIRPQLLVLAELELWPNLIRLAHEAGVRVAIVNGRLSERSFRGYRRLGPLLKPVLAPLDLVAVQNDEYAQRFRTLGAAAERVVVTGSLKFDGAETDRDNPATRHLAKLAQIAADDLVFLAGSTQEPEESLALAAFRQLAPEHPHLRLIVVPRHPDRFDAVAQMLDSSGLPWQRRSQLETAPADPRARILLIDTIGELGAWWGTAHVAFVGGSLSRRGGQNMIEPAAYGAAVCFGPNTQNFRDVVASLLAAEAAVEVAEGSNLTSFVRRCLEQPSFREALGERARAFVAGHLGATSRSVDRLTALLEPRAVASRGEGLGLRR